KGGAAMNSNSTGPVQAVLGRLEGIKPTGLNKWEAYCPAHENPPDGHKQSLTVSQGEDGRALVYCHAGCQRSDVLAAIDMKDADLFLPKPEENKRRIVQAYDYCDKNDELIFQVVRYEPKDFLQRRPNGKGPDGKDSWIWKLNGAPRVLYRLPELLAADPSAWVFVPEGEKDVDNLRGINLVATTNPGGKGKWKHLADDSALHGRRVAIIPDKDKDGGGMKHAKDIAKRLYGKAAEVRIVELPDLPPKGDVSDWLDGLDCRPAEELRAALLEFAESAPVYEPSVSGPILIRLSDVKPEPLTWLWPGRMPLGKVTVISGDPGLGKSVITLDIAARVSKGTAWPDLPDTTNPSGSVILLSAEDDVADTIRPRLDAAEADVSRIAVLEAVRYPNPESGAWEKKMFSLRRDLSALEKAIKKLGDVRLIVIDPITAYLDGTDSHKNADVRGLLAPLSELAAKHKVAVLAVSHLN
ncbi:hypothetical protein LCGC14_2588990, partial [marine sediment metagenome]